MEKIKLSMADFDSNRRSDDKTRLIRVEGYAQVLGSMVNNLIKTVNELVEENNRLKKDLI